MFASRRLPRTTSLSRLASAALLALSAATLPAHAAGPTPANEADHRAFVPGRILLMPRAGLPDRALDRLLAAQGAHAGRRIGANGLRIVEVPAGRERAVVRALARHPFLKFAELDGLLPPAAASNDPYYGSQWHHATIGSAAAWDAADGAGVTIAILDTGVDAAHPDLAPHLLTGWNFYDNSADTSDPYNHGTGVAGTAAAVTGNAVGVAGVAGQARILPVRIAGANGSASYSAMAQGLMWAADQGARVANLSYMAGGIASVQSAAQYMKGRGGLVFVAAGNTGTDAGYAATDALIPVGATTTSDQRASWSTYGAYVSLSAPGAGIWTTTRGGGYVAENGTSFSSPVAAGVAAAVLAANPSLTAAQAEQILFSTAVDLGAAGRDPEYGHGRVDAAAAVQAALAAPVADIVPPTAALLSPAAGASLSGIVAVDLAATDDVGVVRADLLVDGKVAASDTSPPFAFAWDSTGVADGTHTLAVRALDAAGNAGASASVGVAVANAPVDVTPPTASLLSPQDGETLGNRSTVVGQAADDGGSAGLVLALLIDGKQVAQGSGGSLSYNWNTRKLAKGWHTVEFRATDAAGHRTTASARVQK